MKKPSSSATEQQQLREKLIGLGENSIRKSYYPELQRQLDNLNERVKLAELVAAIGQGLTVEPNLQSALQRCAEVLEERTDASFVRIWTVEENGEWLTLMASAGLHTRVDGTHNRLNLKNYPYKIGFIARERKPFLTNDVSGNPQFHNQQWVTEHGIVAFAGYPLILQQQLVGVIALFARVPLRDVLLTTLAAIANQIAIGIERFRILDAYKTALAIAREGHEKVDGILRSVADALLVIDTDRRILHMNQAAEALLGTSLSAAARKRVDEISREPALLNYLSKIDEFTGRNDDVDLAMHDTERNEQRVIQARTARLKGAQTGAGVVVSLRDVTQDREMARMKSEFISTAAHELRTPLTTILGFTELLLSETNSPETQHEYLSHILDKAGALERIIDDLLDLSRIESGRGLSLHYSNWNLVSTLSKIMTRYQTEHPNYRFKIELPDNLGTVHADQGKIMQVIDNLLINAIKYSQPGTEIVLKASCASGILNITITDQGIGMTAEQLASCFEKFYRADASTTAIGGLGLGLSIVRYVVEAHCGSVKAESSLGQGTVVTFSLPINARPELTDTFSSSCN